jgi:hypothetical protein
MDRNALLESATRLDGRKLLVLFAVVVATILIDSEVGVVSDFIPEKISSSAGISLFVCTVVIFAISGFFILSYVKQIGKESGATILHLNRTHKLVTVVQYVLVAIIAFVVLQIVFTLQYNTFPLALTISISYGLWIMTMALLARAFYSWYKSIAHQSESQSKILILILGFSMVAYFINGIFLIANYLVWLEEQSPIILSTDVAYFPDFEPETLVSQIGSIAQTVSAVAYVLTWISTVILLRPYMKKIGRIKFWSIMGFALVYYLISYPLFVLGYFTPSGETDTEVMNNILVVSMSSIVAGIIFGVAFLSIARTLRRGTAIRDYLILAAYGMLIFYIAGSATVSQAAYPPFGLVSTAFTGLSTYLIYVGLYSSAVTLSQDLTLRKTIRKSVMEQSKLLDSIGTAQMERELQTSVLTIVKKTSNEMKENSGIEASLSEDDIRDYMSLVIRELKRSN